MVPSLPPIDADSDTRGQSQRCSYPLVIFGHHVPEFRRYPLSISGLQLYCNLYVQFLTVMDFGLEQHEPHSTKSRAQKLIVLVKHSDFRDTDHELNDILRHSRQ